MPVIVCSQENSLKSILLKNHQGLWNTLFLIFFLKMGSNRPVDGPTGLILPPIDLSRKMNSKNIQFVGFWGTSTDEPRWTATNRDRDRLVYVGNRSFLDGDYDAKRILRKFIQFPVEKGFIRKKLHSGRMTSSWRHRALEFFQGGFWATGFQMSHKRAKSIFCRKNPYLISSN